MKKTFKDYLAEQEKFRDHLAEEEYDRQRDKDAVSGKPRKLSVGSGGGKPKGYSKDEAEQAALDNIKKMPQFSKEDAPKALKVAGGVALGTLTGVGGALIGQMFAPFLGGAAGGIAGAVGGYKAGAGGTDALWNTIASKFGSEERAQKVGMAHAKAAADGEKHLLLEDKEYPVTLKPENAGKAVQAVKQAVATSETIRIKELAGISEETYDGDDFYEAYGDLWFNEDEMLDEAEYQGRKVKLGKPMRGDVKKFKVYVKNPKGNVVKVNFGDPDMKIKKSNPARRRSFRARHNCDNPGPRTKARYWSCRKW